MARRSPALRLGERSLYGVGDLAAARRHFEVAYGEATSGGDPDGQALAAVGLGGLWVHEWRDSLQAALVRSRQRRALAGLEPGSPVRLRLQARLAAEQDYLEGGYDRVLTAVDEARQTANPSILAEAAGLACHCLLGPRDAVRRRAVIEELLGAAASSPRRVDRLMALVWNAVDLVLVGDLTADRAVGEVRRELARGGHLAVEFVVAGIDGMQRLRDGDLGNAEHVAGSTLLAGRRAGDVDAPGWAGGQLAVLRWHQGRLAELVPQLTDLAGAADTGSVDRASYAGLAVALACAGDQDRAARALARARGERLGALPQWSGRLLTLTGIVETASLLGDRSTAREAYAELESHAGLPVMLSLGAACWGSTQQSLGVAAATYGDLGRAVHHLEAAVRDNERLGNRPAAIFSRHRLSLALADRGEMHDRAAAEEHLALARHEAQALGIVLVAAQRQYAVAAAPRPGSAGSPQVLARRDPDGGWRLLVGERTVTLRDSVGMRYLAVLIARPGEEVAAGELVRAVCGAAPSDAGPHIRSGARRPDSGRGSDVLSWQPMLDARACAQYRQRLAALAQQVADLEAAGDQAGAAVAGQEREWLVAELSRAAGQGGRSRGFADDAERARVAVTNAIRRCLDRICAVDQTVGDQLRAAVYTGRRCSFRVTTGPGGRSPTAT